MMQESEQPNLDLNRLEEETKIEVEKINNEELKELLNCFNTLYKNQDPIHQEYELCRISQKYNLPMESVRLLFTNYCNKQVETEALRSWLLSPVVQFKQRIEPLARLIASLGSLSVLIGVITFVYEIPQRREQKATEIEKANYNAWAIINVNEGKKASSGRISALQNLNERKVDLSGINAKNAYLSQINLKGANLFNSDFSYANLTNANLNQAQLSYAQFLASQLTNIKLNKAILSSANLFGSDLTNADLTGANLGGANLNAVNLSGAKLQGTQLQKAIYDHRTIFPSNFNPQEQGLRKLEEKADLSEIDLREFNLSAYNLKDSNFNKTTLYNVNFKGSILTGATFKEARINGADFRGAIGLTLSQMKEAIGWESAKYDASFSQQLGIVVELKDNK
ncbi:pentapeptide repeat-containing protein [Fortiea sp. LEGE XX443]|uniref:pentapeptide repeat-containing protein n=1 Tax=Fortiea sp. LEGE XX443 TaxID=1828611 RepID=UPI001880413F|nr:pentapeptide repeat-containing protein [Fortiea sp. LEGE XX443]MBE9006575.1 pentapeptide repeat-containing protein [Fortiea sp. LEGE XX443]